MFLIIIAVDHFAWTPSLFVEFITQKSFMFASAAEGFFVISGMLVGYIYGPRFLKSTGTVIKRIWKRSLLLYVLAVGFTIFYTLWHTLAPSYGFLTYIQQDAGAFMINTFLLQHSYGWADFLGRYAVFMLFAPLVLLAVVKGKWYIAAICSILLWVFAQFTHIQLQFSVWQILFVGGIITGYYLPAIESYIRSLPNIRKKILLVWVPIVGIVTYILAVIWMYLIQYAHEIAPPYTIGIFNHLNIIYHTIEPFLTRDSLAVGRLLIGTLWFWTLFLLVRRHEQPISHVTRGVLEVLGKNSLFVYSFHAFVLFLIGTLIPPPDGHSIFLNTVLGALFVTVLIIAALIKERIPRYNKKQQL